MSKQDCVHDDYTVGWICPLEVEQIAAIAMLDQQHARLSQPATDPNSYVLGSINGHNVVMAGLPTAGNCSTATVVAHMRRTFPYLRFGLLVGIGGGVPIRTKAGPIRLGHVVVSEPTAEHSGAIQYDHGKAEAGEFRRTGSLAPPPNVLLNAVGHLTTFRALAKTDPLQPHLQRIDTSKRTLRQYKYPGFEKDHLYEPDYIHADRDLSCRQCGCDASKRVAQGQRGYEYQENSDGSNEEDDQDAQWVIIHRGTIASGEKVMKSGIERNKLGKEYGVLCFEMEAAGALNDFPCLVIRGISDYADSHKSDEWKGYAAATAAAYARELFNHMPIAAVAHCKVTKDNTTFPTTDPTSAPSNTSLNNFSSSTNHGIQAHTIHGGIHYYHTHQLQSTQRQRQFEDKAPKDALLQADAAIRKYYESTERLKIERLSGETLSLEECYINLALIDLSDEKQRQDDKPSFSLKARLMLEAKDVAQHIILGDLFTPRKLSDGAIINPRRIFIRGRAGIGKTTLCKKIVYEFLHNRLGGKLFDRLLWLPLRSLGNKNNSAKYGWLEVLQDAFSPSPQVPSWNHLAALMSDQLSNADFQLKTLFLLDGLDEVSHEWKREDDVFKFLETIICDAPNVIITSRPQPNNLKIGRFDIELETIGFTPDQVTAYIDYSVKDEQTRSSMKNSIAAKPLLQGLLRIPVQLDAFCCTWSSQIEDDSQLTKIDNSSTITTLYSSISIELSRKDLVRIRRYDQAQMLEDLDVMKLVEDEHRFLEVFAFQGLINNIIEFSPQHQRSIDFHFRQSGITLPLSYKHTLQQLSFLRTSDVQQHQNKKNYHFLHLTFQEFFAASHFVRHWLSNADLSRLDLGSAMSKHEEAISPIKFLQTEKYNPRLNIFWRFVTGLVQQRSEYQRSQHQNKNSKHELSGKCRNILTFFDELNDEPRDLFGAMHCRLLMYCLSEVVSEKRQDIQDMQKEVKSLLRQGIIAEYNSFNRIPLGEEAEFPESILLSLFHDGKHIPGTVLLSALRYRSSVSTGTLHAIFQSATRLDLQFEAIRVIFKNSRTDSQDIVAQAVQTLYSDLEDKHSHNRKAVVDILAKQPPHLSEKTVNTLLALLKDKDEELYVRNSAAWTLGRQSIHLSGEITSALIMLLRNKNSSVQYGARETLKGFTSRLPEEAFNALLTMLKDEDSSIRESAAQALGGQSSYLSEEAFNAIVILFKDEASSVRHSAAEALERSSSLPEKVINALLALLKDEDHDVQGIAAGTLRRQSPLSEGAFNALLALFEDEDSFVRSSAALALNRQSSLPEKAINALLAILKDKDPLVRYSAIIALGEQSSLPEEVINTLITLLKDESEDSFMRSFIPFSAAEALLRQSLSEEAISTLIGLLKDNSKDLYVQESIVTALEGQLFLPEEAINTLLPLLTNTNPDTRRRVVNVLGKQSSHLSKETINALLKAQTEDAYKILRHHGSFYSMINDLDDQAWQGLWLVWCRQSIHNDTSFYEFEGSLFLWSDGVKHKITDQPEQTQKLLQVVLNRAIKRESEVVAPSDINVQSELVIKVQGSAQTTLSSSSELG